MAALYGTNSDPVVDLRDVNGSALAPVLDEEMAAWSGLDWDLSASSALIRRFLDVKALAGYALKIGGRVAGYSYFVCEENKGLIGGLYVQRAVRSIETENALIEPTLRAMWNTPGIKRIEAQLLMLSSPLHREVPDRARFRMFPRRFLHAPLSGVASFRERRQPDVAIEPWTPADQEGCARLLVHAYAGHVDSLINDQYRSIPGARRFLMNIVQFPGCGSFFAPASFVARIPREAALGGMSLASLVAPGVGHITQLCIEPAQRGSGLGSELLRRSLLALAAHNCGSVSLTVTASNREAIRLYERMGFVNRHDFAAYVWDPRQPPVPD